VSDWKEYISIMETIKKDALYPLNIQYTRPWTQVYKEINASFEGLLNT